MREILFRAKRKDNNEWVYGSLQCFKGFSIFDAVWKSWFTVSGKTIGQYTGLTDKTGKKIFEGDIVRTKFGRPCEVIWHSSWTHIGWDLQPGNNALLYERPSLIDLFYEDNLLVLGNIYDNPELLEK